MKRPVILSRALFKTLTMSECNECAWMIFPLLGVVVATVLYFSSKMEEKAMQNEFGEDWRKYL